MKDSTEVREAKALIKRMSTALGVKSKGALAQALGIAQQSIYNAQAKGKIPEGWVKTLADNYNLSADWLFYGTGQMRRNQNNSEVADASGLALRVAELEAQLREKDNFITVLTRALADAQKKNEKTRATEEMEKHEVPTAVFQYAVPQSSPIDPEEGFGQKADR